MPQASKKAAEGFAAFKAPTQKELTERLEAKLLHHFSVQPEEATNENLYNALVLVLRDLMRERRVAYISETHKENAKQVYYLCMEFLMGRSLKNTLYNLNMTGAAEKVMRQWGVKLDTLYELEPDAGLGNGGLGRLAACFLDGLATQSMPAIGYSLLYEYGIFRQKLVDGWQTELPDSGCPAAKAGCCRVRSWRKKCISAARSTSGGITRVTTTLNAKMRPKSSPSPTT